METAIERKPKKKPKRNSGAEGAITEMHHSLEGFKSRFAQAEERTRNLKTRQRKL